LVLCASQYARFCLRQKRFNVRDIAAPHRPTVDGASRRLTNSVEGKHDRIDRLLAGYESVCRVTDHPTWLVAQSPLNYLMWDAALE
jgi:hypothetical protein